MRLFFVLFALLLPIAAHATSPAERDRPLAAGAQCSPAIDAAERAARLPPMLLRSISMVESARVDPQTGRIVAWPWTINAGGVGYFFETKEAAIAAVEQFRRAGVQSIDVGCMQVNLMYHPDALASLDVAFEPWANAAYAAKFVTELYTETRTWPATAAAYHSQTPDIGLDYARKVYAQWSNGPRFGGELLAVNLKAPMRDYSKYTPEMAAILKQADLDHARLAAAHAPVVATPVTVANAKPAPMLRLIGVKTDPPPARPRRLALVVDRS
jgi:hypothetical protein